MCTLIFETLIFRLNKYLSMFFKVMSTYIVFLGIYVVLIFAFGLAFFIILHKNVYGDPNEQNNSTCCGKDCDYIYFDTPWLALVKTSTMFVGELEFSEIPIYDVYQEPKLRPLVYVFFLIFVFLIGMVLMNLLNGLAVSDVVRIEKEAEVWANFSTMDVIMQVESIFLSSEKDEDERNERIWLTKKEGEVSSSERSWFGNLIRGKFVFPNLSLLAFFQNYECCKKILHERGNQVLIFESVLKDSFCYTIRPNEDTKIFPFIYPPTINDSIIKKAKLIVFQRGMGEQNKHNNGDEKIEYIERNVDMLKKNVDRLEKKVDKIENLLISMNDKLSSMTNK